MTALTFLVINFLVFHTCWLANAFGAAHGMPWLGPTFIVPSLVLHLWLIEDPLTESRMIITISVIGYLADTTQFALGIFGFHSDQLINGFPPIWLFFQWMIFATLFRVTLNWLQGQYLTGSVLGAIGGPLSYLAAVQLNSMMLEVSIIRGALFMAVQWALLMPLFLWLAHRGRVKEELVKRYTH